MRKIDQTESYAKNVKVYHIHMIRALYLHILECKNASYRIQFDGLPSEYSGVN